LRQTSCVLYIAVDGLIPVRGKAISGFDEFTAALDHAGIPAVWLTSRSRLQFDEPRRRLGHRHPFIAEDGCGIYLPADYFHLLPDVAVTRGRKVSTLRLGRFTCIPIAKALPAASEGLTELSEDSGIAIVALRALSPRELSQNLGLPPREAELVRQRDFDELFFFAGAPQESIDHFLEDGRGAGMEFRPHGALWSAAIGASIPRCVAVLSKLYDRALRNHAPSVAVATPEFGSGLFGSCDRTILLSDRRADSAANNQSEAPRTREIPLNSPAVWERVLETVGARV